MCSDGATAFPCKFRFRDSCGVPFFVGEFTDVNDDRSSSDVSMFAAPDGDGRITSFSRYSLLCFSVIVLRELNDDSGSLLNIAPPLMPKSSSPLEMLDMLVSVARRKLSVPSRYAVISFSVPEPHVSWRHTSSQAR